MYTLLDNKGAFFASSISIDAMMTLMRGRWAGTVVDDKGTVIFDIATDRAPDAKMTAKLARAERDLAWKRAGY